MLTIKMKDDCMHFYDQDTLILSVEETETDSGILMTLKGSLRSDTAHHIQDELDAFTTVGVRVTMDLSGVTFLAPSVLNALLNAQQLIEYLHQGELRLRKIPDTIYAEMDETGITELLVIEE